MLYQFKYKIITALLTLIDLSPCPAYDSLSFLPVSLSLPVIISRTKRLTGVAAGYRVVGIYVCCQTHFILNRTDPCLAHQFRPLTPAEFSWSGVVWARADAPFLFHQLISVRATSVHLKCSYNIEPQRSTAKNLVSLLWQFWQCVHSLLQRYPKICIKRDHFFSFGHPTWLVGS